MREDYATKEWTFSKYLLRDIRHLKFLEPTAHEPMTAKQPSAKSNSRRHVF